MYFKHLRKAGGTTVRRLLYRLACERPVEVRVEEKSILNPQLVSGLTCYLLAGRN